MCEKDPRPVWHFVQKFPWEELRCSLLPLCARYHLSFPSSSSTQQPLPADSSQTWASVLKTFPSFRWQLYVSVSLSGLPVDLWSWQHAMVFDFCLTLTVCRLAKGCLKIDQSEQGLKAGVQLGEDQKRHKPKWEPFWGYTVAAGSHNFLWVFFFMALFSRSYLVLRMLNSSVKGLQGFIWCWQRETLCLFPL